MTSAVLEHPACPATPTHRRRVLLIAYAFPPVGGAGVQRPVKWVKYLRRAGWDVTVLTPSNPSVPVLDDSLLAEIPPETRVLRAPTWEPGYAVKQGISGSSPQSQTFLRSLIGWGKSLARHAAKLCLQPDPQILWYPGALRAAVAELSGTPHDAILCTAPPYSSFLIGRALKRRFGLPLILDYRDEWDLSSQYLEHAHRDRLSRFVQERQQRTVLRSADAIIATTQASVDRIGARLQQLGHQAEQVCIYNGFDEEDFSPSASAALVSAPAGHFRLVYTGTLWNLTDVAPLVAAIEQLFARSPHLTQRLEFVCIGRKTPEQQQLLSRLAATNTRLIDRGYCDHAEAVQWLRSADALCLLLSDVPGADRVVPAKLFEYLAARRDVLAIAPDGEAAGIIERYHPAGRLSPRDVGGIAHWLENRLSSEQRAFSEIRDQEIAEFSRERQTDRLVELLDSLQERVELRGARK